MKLGGSVPGDVSDALVAYADYYRTVHGEVIKPWPLVIQILRTFVDEDRAFQTWRRRNSSASAEAQARSSNEARVETGNGRK
jgi:hypothetical protein